MYRLIETIKVIHGEFINIYFHNLRFNKARAEIWNCRQKIDIAKAVTIPDDIDNRTYKCRILYSPEIEQVEFLPYDLPYISRLKLIDCNDIDYRYKYEDRSLLNRLFDMRFPFDDILIIKEGWLTDTSYCNIVLRGGTKHYTPSTPLLNGTKRQQLIQDGKIMEKKIAVSELYKFQTIYLINAMIDLEDNVCISVKDVY